MEIEIKDSNYKEVAAKEGLLVLDFWATWCGPCRALSPVMTEIAKEYDGKGVTVGKVNCDDNEDLSAEFSIRNIPTLLFIRNGEVKDKVVGLLPKEEIKAKIDALL